MAGLGKHSPSDKASAFDPARNIRLVPPFQEKEVDKYFAHFEKVADSLNWPKESWVLLLQSVLVGKAQEIYGSLSVEQSSNYEHVKEAILKAYELVPEAYRQKFRNYLKFDSKTHVEFAREKENLFNRWCHSKEIGQDIKKLKQMVLLEEFKDKVRPDQVWHSKDCVGQVAEKEEDTESEVRLGNNQQPIKLQNSQILNDLGTKLSHLPLVQRKELAEVITQYREVFPDVPSKTNLIEHDVDVGDYAPIKQHPYRVSPMKKELLDKEVQYMLKNDIIEESQSNWSSPCILVPKHDGGFRFCTDFRKVNDKTKSDSFPIPRIADCIDQIGNAKFVSTFDMLKGYWQVHLTQRAREISAFVTLSG